MCRSSIKRSFSASYSIFIVYPLSVTAFGGQPACTAHCVTRHLFGDARWCFICYSCTLSLFVVVAAFLVDSLCVYYSKSVVAQFVWALCLWSTSVCACGVLLAKMALAVCHGFLLQHPHSIATCAQFKKATTLYYSSRC